MHTQTGWNLTRRSIFCALGVALIGTLSLVLFASAAPVNTGNEINTTDEPQILSAVYVPKGTTIIMMPVDEVGEDRDTNLLLCANVEIEMIPPGARRPITKQVTSVSYVCKEDLEEFPSPLELIMGDAEVTYYLIDSTNPEKGLLQLQEIHKLVLEMQGEEEEQVGDE